MDRRNRGGRPQERTGPRLHARLNTALGVRHHRDVLKGTIRWSGCKNPSISA